MTDEIEILRRYRDAPPPPSQAARESAGQALARAVERERSGIATEDARRTSHAPRWRMGALAVAATVIVAIALAASLRSGTTAGPPSAAAAVLTRLADTAAAQPSPVPAPGQYLYTATKSLTGGSTILPDHSICTVHFSEYRQNWIARNGEGLIVETDGPARYSSTQEAARCGTTGETHGSSYTWAARECLSYESALLSKLPRDPTTLRGLILTGKVGGGPPGPAWALRRVADLLRRGNVPPALRADLYRAVAGVSGVALLGPAEDELGRRGVALAADGEGSRTELLFAPATGELLAERQHPLSSHRPAGTVLGWTVFLPSRVVDRLPERSPLPLSPPCIKGGGTSRSVPGKPQDEVLVGMRQR
ncbi:MAG TPA: CU044_5270 family protein [Solirubrobacteraceae bacterium]